MPTELENLRVSTWENTPHVSLTVIHPDTGKHAEYKELAKSSNSDRWQLAMCKELGRLFQGFADPTHTHDTAGTATCTFICRNEIPQNKKPTYVRIVTAYREQKEDPYRVRMTIGGNLIDYPGNTATKTADLVTAKILIKEVISNPKRRAVAIDIKDFNLNNDLPDCEYIWIPVNIIPDTIYKQYNLQEFENDGYVYARVDKGMYGLPQAGRIASDTLLP